MTCFRLFSIACGIALAALPSLSLHAQQPIHGGVVEGSADKTVLPVRIAADQTEIERLAAQAFGAHGAFSVSASAATTIRFAVTGPASVRVTVERGRPARAELTQDVGGTSLRNALFRAADAAVAHLTRRPGFFAGRLTFISERTGASEVYVSDVFFGDALQMTSDRAQCVTPRWAPDGRRILYTSYFANGMPDIYLIDTGTKQRSTFVSIKGTNTGGRFSPNGSRVAMVLSPKGNGDLYVGNAQGRDIRALVKTPNQIEATPSWSPDGGQIVFASDALATGKPQLYTISASGGTATRLPTNVSGYCAEPDWSHADRNLIAFTAASGRGYQIALYNASTRTAKVITQVAGDAIEPSWTNDGRHVIFTQRTSSAQRICILDTESGRVTQVSPANYGKAYQASFIMR